MSQVFEKKEITKKKENFSRWYQEVILKAELADYTPVKGCMVIRPYGYAIWENIKKALNHLIEEGGAENAYFPLFIPYSFLEKEKDHVKGFSPELAVVTHGGGEKLSEPLVVRPTSETIMYPLFSKWISSWRDLPLKINQWCNVVRWEKRTYLFLRTTEFLWQEGHTAHETFEGAEKEALDRLLMYQKLVQDFLSIPVLIGPKSEKEKFPGALTTYTFEALMPDGKALQAGTSHNLGQNFSKVFEIKFQDKKGKLRFAWQTSWGLTTRIIGALIMVHGDNNGLILPPKIAPIQAVIIPIPGGKKKEIAEAQKTAEKLRKEGVRVKVDDRKEHTPGFKFNQWELKGVPLRIEIGEKEVEGGYVTMVKRNDNLKLKTQMSKLQLRTQNLLNIIQKELYQRAEKFLKENTHQVQTWQEFKKIMKKKRGFIKAFWCGDPKCEEKIKEKTKATTRLLLVKAKKKSGCCIYCSKPSFRRWYFAQAY